MDVQWMRRSPSRREILIGGVALAVVVAAAAGFIVGRSSSGDIAATAVAVADLTVTTPNGEERGSGIVVAESGQVVTTYHAVTGAVSISVLLGGHTYYASAVALDPGDDIAVLQVLDAPALPAAPFADGSTLHVGDPLTVIGSDAGAAGAPLPIAASVTALGQTITSSDPDAANPITLTGLIEFAAQAPPQGVGGAVVDGSGRTVGMFVAGSARLRGSVGPDIGYAVPAAMVREVAHEAATGTGGRVLRGNGGYLGIDVRDADTTAGALVVAVPVGTPAYIAGIEAGDVIVSVDSVSVTSADALAEALRIHMGGDRVLIGYLDRNRHFRQVSVQLAASTT